MNPLAIKAFNSLDEIDDLVFEGKPEDAKEKLEIILDMIGSDPVGIKENEIVLNRILSLQGLISRYQGKINDSLDLFFRSLAKSEEIENNLEKCICLHNIGKIYLYKGDPSLARQFFDRSMSLASEIQDPVEIAVIQSNIGITHQMMGEMILASKNLNNGLNGFEKENHRKGQAEALYHLIKLNLLEGNEKKVLSHVEKIKKIANKEKDPYIKQISDLSIASVLKTSNRMGEWGEAQEMFQSLLNKGMIKNEFAMEAQTSLCELLLREYGTFENEEILKEIEDITNTLYNYAIKQNSMLMQAQTAWLKSKLALLKLDIKQARQLLAQAQEIANTQGLKHLAMLISSEHDSLLGQLAKYDTFVDHTTMEEEGIQPQQLETTVLDMIRQNMPIITERPQEEPVMFLVVTGLGASLYSKNFLTSDQIDDRTIGGFLTAVQGFGKEMLGESQSIDRIMYEEFTITLKALKSVMFCYVFKGQSYSALEKMDQLMKKIPESSEIYKILYSAPQEIQKLSKEHKDDLDRFISEIFVK